MSKTRIFNRWTLFFIALGTWVVMGLPFWWLSVGFGAPLVPSVDLSDPIASLFTASFYLPLLVMIGVAVLSVCDLLTKKTPDA